MTDVATSQVSIIDLETGESLELPWAPSTLSQGVSVERGRPRIPGHSHSPTQYIATNNQEFNLSIVLDADLYAINGDRNAAAEIDRQRQFLLSLQYPRRSRRLQGAGTPMVLLNWPNNIQARGNVDNAQVRQEEFYPNLALRRCVIDLTFVEELAQRVTSQDVRRLRVSEGMPGLSVRDQDLRGVR